MIRDILLAFRALRRRPGYAAALVMTLAIGVGASTSIFTFIDSTLLQPPPFPEPSRLGVIWGVAGPERNIRGASYLEIKDWKTRSRTLADVVLYDEIALNMSTPGSTAAPERVDAEMVSAGYFTLLGAQAAIGRTFQDADDAVPDQRPVAIISDGLWRRQFGARADVLGREVLLNDRSLTIIGVMKPGFSGFSLDTHVWVPSMMMSLTTPAATLQNRGTRWLAALTRLKDGVSPEAAQADLDAVAASLAREFPDTNTGRGAQLQTLEAYYFGTAAGTLRLLFGAVLLFLLVACSNVAALQLARSTSRRHETVVSLALGASRGHLMRQLGAEAFVLGAAGATVGALIASWMLAGIKIMQPDGALPAFVEPAINARALGFAAAMAFVSALAASLLPVLAAPASNVADALRAGARSIGGGLGRISRPAPQQLLVIAQVAIALALLIGAGIVIRTVQAQLRVPLGFNPEQVTFARVTLTGARYTPEERRRFADRLDEGLRAMPGVTAAAISDGMPFTGANASILVREPDFTERVRYYVHSVSPGYFETLGMTFVAGRTFTGREKLDDPRVAIVSESGAKRLFPGRNAVGLRFRLGSSPTGPETEIIGIVADPRLRNLTADLGASRAEPDVFFPYSQRPDRPVQFAVRTGGTTPTAEALQQVVSALDPALPVYAVEQLSVRTARQTANRRFTSAIMGAFSLATLLLAAIGLYGLVSYVVSLSRREIAVRLALGANRARVVRLVVRNGMTLVAAGAALGLGLSWGLLRVASEWLGTNTAIDPVAAAGALGTLLLAGTIAAVIPAFGAAAVDPNAALRAD